MKLTLRTLINYLAFGISAIFSPYVAAAIFIVLVVYKYAQDFNQFLPWMVTFFVFAIVLPGFYILWLLESRKITDIHMANARERRIPLMVAAISAVAGAAALYFLQAAKPVFVISIVYAINSLMIAVVSQWWKISVHTGMFASICTVAVIVFGVQFWWMYLILIPLAWSRIHRKRHTIWQAVMGAVATSIITMVIFWMFGYV